MVARSLENRQTAGFDFLEELAIDGEESDGPPLPENSLCLGSFVLSGGNEVKGPLDFVSFGLSADLEEKRPPGINLVASSVKGDVPKRLLGLASLVASADEILVEGRPAKWGGI